MKKVLLCTPFEKSQMANWGGISVWANNILSFAHTRHDNDGIQVIPVSFDRYHRISIGMNPFLRLFYGYCDIRKSIRSVRRVMRETNIDVVHVCSSASWGLIKDLYMLYLSKRKKKKYVVHFHFGKIPDLQKKNNLEWQLLKYVVRHADSTIVMTSDSLSVLKSYTSRVYYVPNPFSDSLLSKINEYSISTVRIPRRIVYVGHVVPNKGIKELVEACQIINGLDIRLIGEMPSAAFIDSLKSLQESASCTTLSFLGKVPHEDVLKELLSAELFVFPSYFEGFPNAVLEAMACGCPIIASNVGAIPEMLDIFHTPCGICVPPGDVKALKNAIDCLLHDSTIRSALASNARQRVEKEYSMFRVWVELIKVWES